MSSRIGAQAYLWAAVLFMIVIPVQFYFAAAGTFTSWGWSPHVWTGLGLHAISALLVVIALLWRLPRRALGLSVLQFILISLQVGFTRLQFPGVTVPIEPKFLSDLISAVMQPIHDAMGSGAGIVAALHGVNGLAIVGVGVLTVRYAMTLNKGAMALESGSKMTNKEPESTAAAKR